MTPYQQHRQTWNSCTACSLCLTRKNVVLARGNIPCEIMFIAEAPGMSEDVIGRPLVGPAGILFDKIVAKASKGKDIKFAYTNLIACIPLGGDGKKTNEPSLESIEACRPRLREFIELCEPRAIITVGKLSEQYAYLATDEKNMFEAWNTITHPAAILRSELSQQGLLVQNCVVTIRDVIEELGC